MVNSYAAAATTEEDRRWGLAGATGSQTLGFVIGPGMVEEKGIMIMMMRGYRKGGSIMGSRSEEEKRNTIQWIHYLVCIKLCAP